MNVLKNIVIFAIFVVVAFALALCWDSGSGGFNVGYIVYGLGCVALFLVLFRRQGLLKSGPPSTDHEQSDADSEGGSGSLDDIRTRIRGRKNRKENP